MTDRPETNSRRAAWILCGLAVLGWLGLYWWFTPVPAPGIGRPELALAGPERANTGGQIRPRSEISRELEPVADGERGGIQPSSARAEGELWVNPRSSGLAWSSLGAVDGLLTFRGNPTRSYYGRGPVPRDPTVLWQRTIGCSNSAVGGQPKQWCGTGWTGQPAVFQAPGSDGGAGSDETGGADSDGSAWWVGVGAYDGRVNFFDPADGETVYPAFRTGDIIKGSITVDPDGYPLVYTGSRDNFFHVVAIDRDEPQELWRLSAADSEPTLWNNDWDSSAVVIGDHLFVGGENSRFYAVRLNRSFDRTGAVTVDPEVIFSAAGWDRELLQAIGDSQVSIENSVAVSGATLYFTNSGGLVQGWDIGGLTEGRSPERVFRYWTGDDTDASIVIDGEGMLYVASEYERGNQRSRSLGQVFKLDPRSTGDPLLWSVAAADGLGSGVWATPALYGDLVIVATDDGRVLGLDRADGSTRWTLRLPGPLWSSPVVIDDTLIQGDCSGQLRAFDLSEFGDQDVDGDVDVDVELDVEQGEDGSERNGREQGPRQLWQVSLGGCIESTPAVWDGRIFVGTRGGDFFAVGDPALQGN